MYSTLDTNPKATCACDRSAIHVACLPLIYDGVPPQTIHQRVLRVQRVGRARVHAARRRRSGQHRADRHRTARLPMHQEVFEVARVLRAMSAARHSAAQCSSSHRIACNRKASSRVFFVSSSERLFVDVPVVKVVVVVESDAVESVGPVLQPVQQLEEVGETCAHPNNGTALHSAKGKSESHILCERSKESVPNCSSVCV